MSSSTIKWNEAVQLVISDVDETIAEVYTPAEPEMIHELSSYLLDGGKLFMVTGGSITRVTTGITDAISPNLRSSLLVATCSGAEVWGFDAADGKLNEQPFYSQYDERFTDSMKRLWRRLTNQLVEEFGLRLHPVEPKTEFWDRVGRHPQDVMFDDRGPQITFGVVNGRDLDESRATIFKQQIPTTNNRLDLRIPIMNRATELYKAHNLPVTARLGGNYSIDLAIEGVSKATAIKAVLHNAAILSTIGLEPQILQHPSHIEVWGDKYSIHDGGTDRHISEALPASVRSIDFRKEDPSELPQDLNIVIWDGNQNLHQGLLEYLKQRPRTN